MLKKGSLTLVKQPAYKKENSQLEAAFFHSENDLTSHLFDGFW